MCFVGECEIVGPMKQKHLNRPPLCRSPRCTVALSEFPNEYGDHCSLILLNLSIKYSSRVESLWQALIKINDNTCFDIVMLFRVNTRNTELLRFSIKYTIRIKFL